jgi:hypothetical protein
MTTKSFLLKMLMLCATGVLLIGCGGSKQVEADKSLSWPEPPDEPRIRFVKSYHGEDDFESKLGALTRTIAGSSSGIVLRNPYDVCTDGDGHIWVTDIANGVILFDEVKNEVKRIGEDNQIPLKSPRGIAYGDNKLFIGLVDAGQVFVLDKDGRFLNTIGRRGQFPNPVDVAFDSLKHRVIVVDNKLHSVFVYSENGDSLFAIGGHGSLDGYFNYPQSVATDSASNVYVVDTFNFRFEKFDSTGKFISSFGKQGDIYGTFSRPKGIAIDTYGNIYVLDAVHHNFQIFNSKYEFLMFVGKFSFKNDGFQDPINICIDQHNRIYVTDHLNGRLQVFQLLKGN